MPCLLTALSPQLVAACLAFWVWSSGFTSIFPKSCILYFLVFEFAAFLPLQLQTAFYRVPWFLYALPATVTQISSILFFFFFLFNNSLQSTHVPFCLLSQNNQHFDFFSIFMFPWWREYYNLFLWLTSFEWYTLQIYFLIFWHSFPLWTLCIQEKHI